MFRGLKALFAGLIAGTALGILFSPEKGDVIRKKIKSERDEGGTGLKTVSDTLGKMGQEVGESAQATYGEIQKTETYQKGAARVKDEFGKVAKQADSARESLQKKVVRAAKKIKKNLL